MAIQGNGKIIVAGSTQGTTEDLAIVRYNADGTLDIGLGGDGIVTAIGAGRAKGVALQADGSIVAAGYSPVGSTIVRFNASGTLDLSFSVDGKQNTGAGIGESVLIQPDGKIVVAGYGFSVARYVAL